MTSIQITHGVSFVTDDDRYRAQDAASAVFARHGVTEAAAWEEFVRQWAWLESPEAEAAGKSQDYADLAGQALVWIEAENAADVALTEGWADPDGASCSIYA